MFRSFTIALAVMMAPAAFAQPAANDPELARLAEQAREAGIAVTADDLWHIGSDTKSMTATLVARLVERGVIGWDDTIGEHLGAVIEDMDPVYPALTFRHLLSHRAGLPANIGMVDMIRFQMEGTGGRPMPEQRLDYATRILRTAPAAEPETRFFYSNAGYVIAGAMLEQVMGKPDRGRGLRAAQHGLCRFRTSRQRR